MADLIELATRYVDPRNAMREVLANGAAPANPCAETLHHEGHLPGHRSQKGDLQRDNYDRDRHGQPSDSACHVAHEPSQKIVWAPSANVSFLFEDDGGVAAARASRKDCGREL